MLIFDQLKRGDPQLRLVTLAVLAGLGVLLAGVWWGQGVSSADYQANLETQSFRSVRIPAVRGKILDHQGEVLAENRPTYNLSMYLDDLRKPFDLAAAKETTVARAELKKQVAAREKQLGRTLNKAERKEFVLPTSQREALRQKARYSVASNVVAQIAQRLQQPLALNSTNFERHYQTRLALPFPVCDNLDPVSIARFEEQCTSPLGVDLEVQSTRFYPCATTAAHLLGHLQRDDSSAEGEESFFSYRLPDFRGIVGIEAACDKELRGMAGAKSVQVNSIGYRTTENVWSPAEPGQNVVLTIDLRVQRAAEHALQTAPVPYVTPVRGAVVVMDVNTGDILAMASSPTLDPNHFIQGWTHEEWQRVSALQAEKNRATQENYAPGSIFKTIVALAALEAGLNRTETVRVTPEKLIRVHGHPFKDTAPPGDYDFKRALKLSSNTYFITMGLRLGAARIVRLAQHVHFGERTGLRTRQEVAGYFPDLHRVSTGWNDISTGTLSIGQDPVLVTPLQIAVLTSALANGGKVLFPRLIDRIEPQDPQAGEQPLLYPRGQVRDELGVSTASMAILHEAMLADTEDSDGTGRSAKLEVPGLRICGKTGTAQIQDARGLKKGQTTWFASFAPFDHPRYAVVVMVEDGHSGGDTCAPVAGKVYKALVERDGGKI